MATSQSVSPGGALLRASRMFSLPPKLPPAPSDPTMRQHSRSATKPYPRHQVITTSGLARSRGDWGLKRPLPLKTTTRSSTPMIRVRHHDTIDNVTYFWSAADHGLALQKWQDLNMPISVPSSTDGLGSMGKSVFEEDMDFTEIKPGQQKELEDRRWKFRGPWLAGMLDGEFKKYLAKQVRRRRPEFRQFLRETLAAEMSERAAEAAQDAGTSEMAPVDPNSITDEQLTDYLCVLRSDRLKLYTMAGRFLDLAPLKPPTDAWTKAKTGSPYAQEGPPITHPSAGLSYLRTAAYLDNHPLYGPQKSHPPVKARVVLPRIGAGGRRGPAKLGVGGFVTSAPGGDTAFNMKYLSARAREIIPGIESLDPSLEGGAKIYVEPMTATINSQGRVEMKVGRPAENAELVAREMAGEKVNFEPTEEPSWSLGRGSGRQREGSGSRTPMIGSSESYGLNFPTPGWLNKSER